MLKYKTDRTWFSHLVWHPAKKWSRSILTTSEPARGWSSQVHRGQPTPIPII